MNSWILFFILVAAVKNGVAIGLEVLYGAERNFTSEGYPNVYPSNAEYAWIIHGGIRVELTFHSFDLQWCRDCSCDYVEVRDGFTSLSPLIGRYCGNHTEPITVISSSEFVYVSFKTDSSISGAGFNASYTITIKCPTLPRKLVGSRKSCGLKRRKIDRNCGELYITFLDEQKCSWYGETTVFRRWEFDFLDEFRFKKCPGCSCEYIEFFDGRDSSSESLGRFCGSDKPDDVKTSGKYMSFKIKAGKSTVVHFKYRGTYSGGTLAALILVPIAVIGALLGMLWCVCLCCVNNPFKEENSVKMTECNDKEAGQLCSAEDDTRT